MITSFRLLNHGKIYRNSICKSTIDPLTPSPFPSLPLTTSVPSQSVNHKGLSSRNQEFRTQRSRVEGIFFSSQRTPSHVVLPMFKEGRVIRTRKRWGRWLSTSDKGGGDLYPIETLYETGCILPSSQQIVDNSDPKFSVTYKMNHVTGLLLYILSVRPRSWCSLVHLLTLRGRLSVVVNSLYVSFGRTGVLGWFGRLCRCSHSGSFWSSLWQVSLVS